MPVSSVFVTRFFQLVTKRQFAEAERVLERLKKRMERTERNRGYFRALRGMLLARKSDDDRYVFLSSLDFSDKEALQVYRREFLRNARDRLHGDYDRGFFMAWADFMRVLLKMETMELVEEKTPSMDERKV